jgi:hypothetical protein
LLRAHDGVADHQSKPSNLGDDDFNEDQISNFGDDTVKIIHLEKTNEPLVGRNFRRVVLVLFSEYYREKIIKSSSPRFEGLDW